MSEEALYCTNHPQRKVLVRCNKCERPFCPSCLVPTPVGMRCRQCANIRPSPIYVVAPARLGLAMLAGLGAGLAMGFALFAIPLLSSFSLWLSPLYGIGVAEAVSVAAKRKRGPALQLVTVLSVALGAVLGKYGLVTLALAERMGAGDALARVAETAGRDLWLMLFIVIAVLVGQTRVR